MNSLMSVYNFHMILQREKCVDYYTIKVDNKSEDVTINIRFNDCNKRFVLNGGRGDAFHNRCHKLINDLAKLVARKNKELEEHG